MKLIILSLTVYFVAAKDISDIVDELVNEVRELRETVSVLQQKEESRAANSDIGFSAYRNDQTNVGAWQTVVYNVVVVNLGGAYDAGTGIFTCPVSGYYYFSVAAFAMDSINSAQILVNSTPYGAAWADVDHADQGSISTIALCNQGTQVWVRHARDGDENYGAGRDGVLYNGFMGFLISITI